MRRYVHVLIGGMAVLTGTACFACTGPMALSVLSHCGELLDGQYEMPAMYEAVSRFFAASSSILYLLSLAVEPSKPTQKQEDD